VWQAWSPKQAQKNPAELFGRVSIKRISISA